MKTNHNVKVRDRKFSLKRLMVWYIIASLIFQFAFLLKIKEARAVGQWKENTLVIALDTLGSTSAQTIITFMDTWNYTALRIYVGWCNSIWSGNLNDPMNTASKNYVASLCDLCQQNGWNVTCMISDQVSPWMTYASEEIQVGEHGEQNSQGNWVDVTGPKMIAFSTNLAVTLVDIMDDYATPKLSLGEFVYVSAGGHPAFYAQSMKDSYYADTGLAIPSFPDTTRPWTTEQQTFIDYVAGKIEDFFGTVMTACLVENASTIFDVLLDTYWVYPNSSYDSQPWDYFSTGVFDQITYEWFYAIQQQNWAGIIDGLQRIEELNPTCRHHFIYGTSTMTTIANMRQAVQLVMDADWDGVELYEYMKSRNNPFSVSDIVFQDYTPPTPLNPILFAPVNVTSIASCPLGTTTFVLAYSDDTNDTFALQVFDTNGTIITSEVIVDSTSGSDLDYNSIGASAFNSTVFVVGWYDKASSDVTFAIYNRTGDLLVGPVDADSSVFSSRSVQVSTLNSTHFVIAWFDDEDNDATFAIYDSDGTLKVGPTDADDDAGNYSYAVDVSAFNSTRFVFAWYDYTDFDISFKIYDSAGQNQTGTMDVDESVSASRSVSVATLNSTHFVIAYFDDSSDDATFAIYDSLGTLVTAQTDVDTNVGTPSRVQVQAVNEDNFVVSWYDAEPSTFDFKIRISSSDGTLNDVINVETWATSANNPFKYHSVCGAETAINVHVDGGKNFIVAYANTTSQAVWIAYRPDGSGWDGSEPYYYYVTFANDGHGTTEPEAGEKAFNMNVEINATATPYSNYDFLNWVINGIGNSTDNPLELTINSTLDGKTVTAYFQAILTGDIAVVLNQPSDGSLKYVNTQQFTYTPVFSSIQNASLWMNLSGAWQVVSWNASQILNNTVNSLSYTFANSGEYIWNIAVYNTTLRVFAEFNRTITFTLEPRCMGTGYSTPTQGIVCTLNSLWNDGDGINGYIPCSNVTGTPVNSSWIAVAGSPLAYLATSEITLPPQVGTVIMFGFYANDTDGKWGVSSSSSFSVVAAGASAGPGLSRSSFGPTEFFRRYQGVILVGGFLFVIGVYSLGFHGKRRRR